MLSGSKSSLNSCEVEVSSETTSSDFSSSSSPTTRLRESIEGCLRVAAQETNAEIRFKYCRYAYRSIWNMKEEQQPALIKKVLCVFFKLSEEEILKENFSWTNSITKETPEEKVFGQIPVMEMNKNLEFSSSQRRSKLVNTRESSDDQTPQPAVTSTLTLYLKKCEKKSSPDVTTTQEHRSGLPVGKRFHY